MALAFGNSFFIAGSVARAVKGAVSVKNDILPK
jgi:hypothetical protein